jgi:hypothetical protein
VYPPLRHCLRIALTNWPSQTDVAAPRQILLAPSLLGIQHFYLLELDKGALLERMIGEYKSAP